MRSSISQKARRVLGAVLVMMAAMAALVMPAAAQPSDVGVQDAAQCSNAPGPGNWNRGCMYVWGTSLKVDKVQVFLEATAIPGYPVDVCNVKFDVWGALYPDGRHWEQTITNPGCGLGTLSAYFYPGVRFKNGSYFCSRTIHAAGGQQPNCIIIKG